MKKFIIMIAFLCSNILFSYAQKEINSEFTISFDYEVFPQKLFSLERHERYQDGVWLSYRIFQKEEVISHQLFSVKASFLTPIVSKYLYSGIEIGFSIPTKSYMQEYDVPALASDLAGDISFPFLRSIEQRYSQNIKNEVEIYSIPVLYKLELRFPLGEKLKFKIGLGMGPKIIIENTKNTTINTYVEDFILYEEGDATSSVIKKTNFYLVPYAEGLVGLNFQVSSRISFGINVRLGYIISPDYADEETDFQQIQWWPEEEELIKLKSGNLFEGINFAVGFELKILI